MPPTRTKDVHEWTRFELHTMLCLLAKGTFSDEHGRKNDSSSSRSNVYLTFATKLNTALHGTDYAMDISKKEVTNMLDTMLAERKGAVGKGGLMERQPVGRITRSLKMAWERNKPIDFDGSLGEWNSGRKERVMNKYLVGRGLVPKYVEKDVVVGAGGTECGIAGSEDMCKQAQKLAAIGERKKWGGRLVLSEAIVVEDDELALTIAPANVETNPDSFSTLPKGVPADGKVAWANTVARRSAYMPALIAASDAAWRRTPVHQTPSYQTPARQILAYQPPNHSIGSSDTDTVPIVHGEMLAEATHSEAIGGDTEMKELEEGEI